MADTVVTVTGLDELIKRLDNAGKPEVIRAALKGAAAHVKTIVSVYPPSSEANVPGQRRWYERGYGSKWTRRDGTVNGRQSSESLGRKWTVKAQGNYSATIGNNVSYAPYVHDPEEQTSFHASRGWKTTKQVADEEIGRVTEFIVRELDKALGG